MDFLTGRGLCACPKDKKKVRKKTYSIRTEKLRHAVKICFLTDYHASEKTLHPRELLELVEAEKPDLLILGGDMATASSCRSLYYAEAFMMWSALRFPVYYGRGNHEEMLYLNPRSHFRYMKVEEDLRGRGVHLLDNTHASWEKDGDRIEIYGFTVPFSYYKKPFPPSLTAGAVSRRLGKCPEDRFSILLGHTPLYAERYLDWGADLTLCGHYHGGVIRFDEHHGAVSPQLIPFPKYCCGDFYRGKQTLIVGAGIGDHTLGRGNNGGLYIPLRYHNPVEMVMIVLEPALQDRKVLQDGN